MLKRRSLLGSQEDAVCQNVFVTSRAQNSGSAVLIEHLIWHDWLTIHAASACDLVMKGMMIRLHFRTTALSV